MIIYQALNDDWVRDFQLTFRIRKGNYISQINSTRDGFQSRLVEEYSHYFEESEIIYKG